MPYNNGAVSGLSISQSHKPLPFIALLSAKIGVRVHFAKLFIEGPRWLAYV